MTNPYYNSNKRGIPTIASTSVTADATNLTITLPSNTFLGKWYQGIIFLEITQAIPSLTGTPSVQISVNGEVRPLVGTSGTTIAGADIDGDGAIYQVYYDKVRNLLQLMTSSN